MLKSWGSCSAQLYVRQQLCPLWEAPQLCSEGIQQLGSLARTLEAQVLGLLAFSVTVVCSVSH